MAQGTVNNVTAPTSVVFQKPAKGLVQTSFVIGTNAGDIVQIQFKSHCASLYLSNITQKRMAIHDEALTSASLLIY